MERNTNPSKRILKPSVIHDELPETKKAEHLRKVSSEPDDTLPENPERNYHHKEFRSETGSHDELRHADDDVWNGEDA